MSDTKNSDSERERPDEWNVTDAGSYTVPGERTSYVEFRLREPNGMHKRCYCNECRLRFYVSPFGFTGECPRCHSDRVAWTEKIGRSLHTGSLQEDHDADV